MEIIQILVCFLHGKPLMVNTQILSKTLLINDYLLWKQNSNVPPPPIRTIFKWFKNTARARGEAGKRSGNEVKLGTYIVKIKRSKKVVK